jgi:hypothetical protein
MGAGFNITTPVFTAYHRALKAVAREMIITAGIFATLFLSFPTLADENIHKLPGSPSVGALLYEDLKSLPFRCECEFYYGQISGETLVFTTRYERTVGFAVVDGKLIPLQRDGRPPDTLCRKNVRYRERWVDGATAIVLDQGVTGSGAEACWYEGKLSATVDGRMVSIPIRGACGC